MADDVRPPLSPSAAIALLTLQVRAAMREADTAEAAVDAIDLDRARADLKIKIDEIRAAKRAALEAELAQERAAAEATVAVARVEADGIMAAARLHAAELAKSVQPEPVMVQPEPVVVQPEPDVVQPVELLPIVIAPAETPDDLELRASVETALARVTTTPAPESGSLVTVDSEAFARVFATVLATVLDERFAAWRSAAPAGAITTQHVVTPSATVPAPPKRSLARRVFQLDTVLMALASAIAIVLLFAWLG